MLRSIWPALLLTGVAAAAVKVGQPAPEITLDRLLPDQPVANASLQTLKGKAVVVEFWAIWCGPCIAAIPHWNELVTRFKDKPIAFLSITADDASEVEPFLKKRPIEGMVGLSKSRKVIDDYGVTGVGRTFLIDSSGVLAADLTAYTLTDAMLEDLLAHRPITVPKTVPFSSTIRNEDESLGKPVFDVMIRPSTSLDRRGGSGRGKDELMFRGSPVGLILSNLYSMPPSSIVGEPVEDKTRYDAWISLPGANPEAFKTVARDVLCAGLHVKATRETRNTDVLILTAPNGKPPGLVEAAPIGGIIGGMGTGSLRVTGPMMALASSIEGVLRKPVFDETGLAGMYEFKLAWQPGVPASLEEAVVKLGLKLEPARRPIEFLVVTKAQ